MTNAATIVDLIRVLLKKQDEEHGVLVMCKNPEVAVEVMGLLTDVELNRVRLQCQDIEENHA